MSSGSSGATPDSNSSPEYTNDLPDGLHGAAPVWHFQKMENVSDWLVNEVVEESAAYREPQGEVDVDALQTSLAIVKEANEAYEEELTSLRALVLYQKKELEALKRAHDGALRDVELECTHLCDTVQELQERVERMKQCKQCGAFAT